MPLMFCRSNVRVVALLALVGLGLPCVHGAVPAGSTRRTYQTQKLVGPAPIIDGKLSDAAWAQGTWAGDFTQREPKEGLAPSEKTEIKILYDDRNLYVAIRAFDSKVSSRARIMGGRDEFAGDMVGISLDSFHNLKTSFEFNVTSAGSKVDLVLDNGGNADTSWNAVWECKVGQENNAWVAEYRIPLSQLRYTTKPEQVWGMHVWRWLNDLQEESNWSLIPIDNPGFIYSFGELKGLENLPPHRRLEVTPYSVFSYKTRAADLGNPFNHPRQHAVAFGGDLKYGVTSNLTLDVTVNPDFGQVEADPSEINLSTVEIYQKERRPYFLEGKNIFDFYLGEDQAYYSRRIGASPRIALDGYAYVDSPDASRILGSMKLTGRTESGFSLGVMAASTEKAYANTYDGHVIGRKLVDPQTNYVILRGQQDLQGGDWVVGGMATVVERGDDGDTSKLLPRSAYTAGAEVIRYWNDRRYNATVRVIASDLRGTQEAITQREDEPVHNFSRVDGDHADKQRTDTKLTGHGGLIKVGKGNGGVWRYNGYTTWRSPGVDMNDAGYLARADSLEGGAQVQYFVGSRGHFFKKQDHRLKYSEMFNYEGLRLNRRLGYDSDVATSKNLYVSSHVSFVTDRLDTRDLRGGPAIVKPTAFPFWFYAEGDGGRMLQPKLELGGSATVDDSEKSFHLGPGFVYRPNSKLSAEFGVEWSKSDNAHQYVGNPTIAGRPAWLVGAMDQHTIAGTVRLAYQFSPDLSVSYYGGPFASSGRFSEFKRVVDPRNPDPALRFRNITAYDKRERMEGFDEGTSFVFDRPMFSWRELKSNFVLRWEYKPGSSIYCVWSQHRSDSDDFGRFVPSDEFRKIFSDHPENTFLIKASYWFSI